MTVEEFRLLKGLEGSRVRLRFADHQEVVATLVSVTTDFDQSQHLVYESVEWFSSPHMNDGVGTFYAGGGEIVSCLAVYSSS